MTSLGWGIIGPGRIAAKFAQALAFLDQALVAVAARDKSKGETFAKAHGAQTVCSPVSGLFHRDDIDVIYIATPHTSHYQLAMQALYAGKHVVIEKPLCLTAQQAQCIADAANRQQRFAMEAMWSCYLPAVQQARAWLEQGKIGKLNAINATIGFAFDKSEAHRINNPLLGGGAMLDLGIYPIALSNWFWQQRPVAIQASARLSGSGIDLATQASLRYSTGGVTQFMTAIDTVMPNTMTLQGESGFIQLNSKFWGATDVALVAKQEQSVSLPFACNGFEYQINAVVDAISGDKPGGTEFNLLDSVDTMWVTDEIRSQIGLRYAAEHESCVFTPDPE